MNTPYITESGKQFGLGHVKRFQAMAELFPELNLYLVLNEDSEANDGLSKWSNEDLNGLNSLIKQSEVVFFDSFIASEEACKIVEKSKKLIAIDDYIRRNWSCGLIVDWTIDSEKNHLPVGNRSCFGLNYLVSRKIFRDKKKSERKESLLSKPVSDWIITTIFGGSDLLDLTSLAINALGGYRNANHIGTRLYPSYVTFKNHNRCQWNLSDEEYVKALVESDVVITAGGQTLYELAVLGIPNYCISTNDNQNEDFIGFTSEGLSLPLTVQQISDARILEKDLDKLILSLDKMNRIDGYGGKLRDDVIKYLCL